MSEEYNSQLNLAFAARFWAKVDKSADCWIWTGCKKPKGYGLAKLGGGISPMHAHRVAWALAHGRFSDAPVIMHDCDNPSCVNPAHLREGDHALNVADMMAKGRHRTGQGSRQPLAKLTEPDIPIIRERYERQDPPCTQKDLAVEYGVSKTTILRVIHRKQWHHV